ncbi:DUF1521 domain-containing protein [Novosphingobium sp. RD2P27]|uniref:DUF1521 domain-containing protein n=1 Tax=Novosphingobium kalidii TaxID=3230299 RepID=A0ABV2D3D0_9SPHN
MTDIQFNTNVTVNNFFGAQGLSSRPVENFQTALGNGIMVLFGAKLASGPFASPMLPNLLSIMGGMMAQAQGQQPVFQPAPDAQWTASLQNQNQASIDLGDGYSLDIDERSSQIIINNANTGETTRIWGDPHVDVDGKHVYDFWGKTTFTLENGTKITIDTEQGHGNPDVYFASKLTITKGDQAIVVDGVSQQTRGDLSVSMSNDGRQLDAATGDGFVLHENATGSGWRSELTGQVATQADLNATKPGQLYGPGSDTPSLGELSDVLSTFLLFGLALEMGEAVRGGDRASASPAFRPQFA